MYVETGDITFSGTELRLEQYLERQDWDFRTKCIFWHGVYIIKHCLIKISYLFLKNKHGKTQQLTTSGLKFAK